MLFYPQKLILSLGETVEAVVAAIEGTVLADVRPNAVEGIFARLCAAGLLFGESLNGRAEELEGEWFFLGLEGRCIALVLSWGWLFGLEDVLCPLLKSGLHVGLVNEGVEVSAHCA